MLFTATLKIIKYFVMQYEASKRFINHPTSNIKLHLSIYSELSIFVDPTTTTYISLNLPPPNTNTRNINKPVTSTQHDNPCLSISKKLCVVFHRQRKKYRYLCALSRPRKCRPGVAPINSTEIHLAPIPQEHRELTPPGPSPGAAEDARYGTSDARLPPDAGRRVASQHHASDTHLPFDPGLVRICYILGMRPFQDHFNRTEKNFTHSNCILSRFSLLIFYFPCQKHAICDTV